MGQITHLIGTNYTLKWDRLHTQLGQITHTFFANGTDYTLPKSQMGQITHYFRLYLQNKEIWLKIAIN